MAKEEKAPSTGDRLARLEQFLSQAPTAAAAAGGDVPRTLGPSESFFTRRATDRPEMAGFKPFKTNDEWLPAYNYTPEDRARLQYRMNSVGLYGTAGYQPGPWTQEDATAFTRILEYANATGIQNPEEALDDFAQAQRLGPRVQGARAPLVSQVSNPDTIRSVLRETAYSLTGQRLSDADEQRLISIYQGREQSADAAVYAAGGTGGPGGTVTGPASPQAFAEAQIESMRPGEVATHRHLEAFEKILGSMGTLADTTPTYQGAGLPNEQAEVL